MKKVIITIAFCHLLITSFSQDIHFSQFWMAPMLQNPAMVGATHDLQAIINYKNQWSSVASPYRTGNLSFDMKLNKKKTTKGFLATGADIYSDKAGDAKMGTTQANLSLGYHVLLNDKSSLGAGLMGGFVQRSMNGSDLQWMSQYDGVNYNSALPSGEPSATNSTTFADFGAGILWAYSKGEEYMTGNNQIKANVGAALFHPQQSKYSYYSSGEKLAMKTVIHGNVLYGIKNTTLAVVPGFMFYKQGGAQELMFGSLFRYTLQEQSKYTGYLKGAALSLGAYYRNKDAVIFHGLFEFAQYAVGVSYDLNASQLKTASSGRGGLEISLRFISPNPFLFKSASRI